MNVTILTKKTTFDFPCDKGERILYAALRAGVPAPFECATGTCGTCRARRKSGDIEQLWPQAPGKKSIKPDKDEFLMCQCTATSDIEILVPGTLADAIQGHAPTINTGIISLAEHLTHDVARFHIDFERAVEFDPGQFLVIEVPELSGYRAYSMTNHGNNLTRLEFVIKQKPEGGFSERLFAGELDDAEVNSFGPLGLATLQQDDNSNLLLLAGGSGIAGIMSILSAATTTNYFENHNRNGHVVFGVRSLDDVFYADELNEYIAKNKDRLKVTIALSDQPAKTDNIGSITLANGFVHDVAAEQMTTLFDDSIGFVAGPPPMVDASIRMLLTQAKLPASNIRYDKFN